MPASAPTSPTTQTDLHALATAFLNENFPQVTSPTMSDLEIFSIDKITQHFDQKFPTYQHYQAFVREHLRDWTHDPDFKAFDNAYCHHRLVAPQAVRLQELAASLIKMSEDLSNANRTQLANIERLAPRLINNGMSDKIRQAFVSGTNSPHTWQPAPSQSTEQETGTRIRNDPTPTTTTPKSETAPLTIRTTPYTTDNKYRCFQCQSTTHFKTDCSQYQCPHCKRNAPGHWPRQCLLDKMTKRVPAPYKKTSKETCPTCRLPKVYDHVAWARGQTDGYTCHCKNKAKEEESDDPDLYGTGFYDISGEEDGNLTGEH